MQLAPASSLTGATVMFSTSLVVLRSSPGRSDPRKHKVCSDEDVGPVKVEKRSSFTASHLVLLGELCWVALHHRPHRSVSTVLRRR